MTTTKPPFYWKVPGIEKDYMFENVQRIRRTAAANKFHNNQPVKATFIPGVTKNAKYAHVTSRVGEFLRSSSTGRTTRNESPDQASYGRASSNNHRALPAVTSSSVSRNSRAVGLDRRLSRSSTDVSVTRRRDSNVSVGDGAASAPILRSKPQIGIQGPGNYVPRAKRKPRGLQIEDESVYNWRFSDSQNHHHNHNPLAPSLSTGGGGGLARKSDSDSKIQGYHRVEYLPCDGICADETIEEVANGQNDGSGRSSSRTSRGINTEETRIIEDFKSLDLSRSQSWDQLRSGGETTTGMVPQLRAGGVATGTMTGNADAGIQVDSSPIVRRKNNDFGAVLHTTGGRESVRGNGIIRNNQSTSAELPHTLGTVPRYLKQRKEEWKLQAEQVAAAVSAADVPPGHILLPESERLETLQGLKATYAALIDELNRVPIRIDTMRVREHKIKLEQQLQKLERGMAIFSRPRVYVKLPEDETSANAAAAPTTTSLPPRNVLT